ncbi:hypothetical protein Mkiyose1088_43010 [Mycobacterium kiyosense]|nr:hypothetical protein Mkiyose1088_43010 [Mycobacterium kiyosense]
MLGMTCTFPRKEVRIKRGTVQFATHADPFPAGYPSYLINGMCTGGADGKTCPGPGVPMPRP